MRKELANILQNKYNGRQASALVVILVCVTLLTIVVIALLITARFERASSGLALSRSQAEILADFAADTALSRIREAISAGTPNYTPGANYNAKTWASMPGRIAVFDLTTPRPANVTYYDLFSGLPGTDDPNTPNLNNVDLNRPSYTGEYPIAPPATGNTAANMKVGWINLLANPGQAAASNNAITGRIAFWVDDETCKVNINTADGSKKWTEIGSVAPGTTWMPAGNGFGTPSEISLAPLLAGTFTASGTTTIVPSGSNAQAVASAIAAYATSAAQAYDSTNPPQTVLGFNSPAEIGRVAGVPVGFYKQNAFNITVTGRTPELNMFGEPRFMLINASIVSGTCYSYAMIGSGTSVGFSPSNMINFVYPTSSGTWNPAGNPSNQLPPMVVSGTSYTLPQFPNIREGNLDPNYTATLRMEQYLKGFNSQGEAIIWPQFEGTNSTTGFAGKYSDWQIDSIMTQIIVPFSSNEGTVNGLGRAYTQADFNVGLLSGKLVDHANRGPCLTEIFMTVLADTRGESGYTVPYLQFDTANELYLPKYYGGRPLDSRLIGGDNSDGGAISGWRAGISRGPATASYPGTNYSYMNVIDSPVNPAAFDIYQNFDTTHWGNTLLQIKDQNNNDAGVDLYGNVGVVTINTGTSQFYKVSGTTYQFDDPNQSMAAYSHPYAQKHSGAGALLGLFTMSLNGNDTYPYPPGIPAFGYGNNPSNGNAAWDPGVYHCSHFANFQYYRGAPGVTEFRIRGGLTYWARGESGFNAQDIIAPMGSKTGNYPSPTGTAYTPADWQTNTAAGLRDTLIKSVIPVSFDVPIPGTVSYDVSIDDPMVSQFPGDWHGSVVSGTSDPRVTLVFNANYCRSGTAARDPFYAPPNAVLAAPTVANNGALVNYNGDNPGYRPVSTGTGGDPLSVWSPPMDVLRYPPQACFPSVGALNSIRTGIIPDDPNATPQKGTPWRSLSFTKASSSGQTVLSGTSYPDWAMLDLFTVPFTPTPKGTPTLPRPLTYGGATDGKLNINNPKTPYPFSEPIGTETVAHVLSTRPQRTAPLDALFYGIQTSTSYTSLGDPVYTTVSGTNPGDPPAAPLRDAVQNYLALTGTSSSDKRCFMIPGEVANLAEIDAFTYKNVAANALSRNDLMRNILGTITTQSNTYSIWVVAQTIKKAPANRTNFGIYEAGDTITGEVRRHYLVERLIEPGIDGVAGNAVSPGADLMVGTADDIVNGDYTITPPVAGYHPKMTYPLPYRWRILLVEDLAR